MSKTKDRVTQVKLERYGQGEIGVDVAWIESKFAKVGKRLTIGDGTTVWTVAEVYGTKDVEDLEWVYKAWRDFAEKLEGH